MNQLGQLVVPSGAIYLPDDLELMRYAGRVGFVRYSASGFILKSGIHSNVYVMGRDDLTDHPGLGWLTGRKVATVVCQNTAANEPQPCLVGLPTAGTSLAVNASLVSWREQIKTPAGHTICYRLMREALKKHGAHPEWVNGAATPSLTEWFIDNVATDGKTKEEAHGKFVESGRIKADYFPPVLIFIDRQQGAVQRLQAFGFTKVVVAYHLLDVAFAFQAMGLWPKDVVASVEKEIEAHQLK